MRVIDFNQINSIKIQNFSVELLLDCAKKRS